MRSWIFLICLLASQTAVAQQAASSLTLEAALSRARANNPTLRGAAAESDAAGARQDRARAPLLPQLAGTAAYNRTTGNFIPRPGLLPTQVSNAPKSDWDMFNTFTFGATASLLLYDFQGSIDRFRSAKETARAAEERVRASELSVDFAVRDAFFRARAQRALVDVARETLANNERHVEQIEAFVAVGTRPQIDLLQVRTERANARVALLQAENGYAIAKANLARAMGSEDESDFEVADQRLPPLANEQAPLSELLSEAVARRPDVIALERELRANTLGETATRGAFGPSLSALATGTRGGLALDDLRWNVAAGVQLNWPIVRGGAAFAERREARANVQRVEASIAELRQTVRLQVEQARLGLAAAQAVIEAAAEALASAKGRLELAEGRYEAGVGNIIELGDAQVALTGAEAQSVSAEYSLSMARAQLISALGRSR